MFDEKLSLIQEGDPLPSPYEPQPIPTPLILIHDGGGTIFSYHCLGLLQPKRKLYGIANPHYDQNPDSFTPQFNGGGIPEMAAEYLSYIKKVFPWGGKIILGGWSLGGLVSLQLSKLISLNPSLRIEVVGIVMIDSVCPIVPDDGLTRNIVQHLVQWGENTREDTKRKVLRCFDEAIRMVGEWQMPEWDSRKKSPPSVILLKARESVPVAEEGGITRVDIHRGDRVLGWDGYRQGLIKSVVEVPGNHFNLFEPDGANLEAVTQELGRACVELERMYLEEKRAAGGVQRGFW
ncbi:Alpha/Beta hydrolase protein [Podospora fimiseda]|uniref:Alpha/Beta hydrolase protein n=1 Tax=Podospora fimiseda TaxID=252190 RepID=A0AAN7BNX6_9PEZI|nr:Alpha/Beta hydrolase protein [Podospora fimiseda]